MMQSYSIEVILQAIKVNRALIKKFWSDYSLGYITIDGLLPANDIRQYGLGKPCTCCGKTMTRDKWSKTPINGWLQEDERGKILGMSPLTTVILKAYSQS